MARQSRQLVPKTGLVNPLGESISTVKSYDFTHRELAELLIFAKGIHEGHWQIDVRFHANTKNVHYEEGKKGGPESCPGMLMTVLNIGLTRKKEATNRTVDAAKVNPLIKEV